MPGPSNDSATATPIGMTLSEGLTHYRWIVDQSHKYWAYFQIVGLGTSGFVWSTSNLPRSPYLFVALGLIFLVFAYVSNRAIAGAQEEAIAALDALKSALPERGGGETDLNNMVRAMSHSPVRVMRAWNTAMVVVTVAAIWYRYDTLC